MKEILIVGAVLVAFFVVACIVPFISSWVNTRLQRRAWKKIVKKFGETWYKDPTTVADVFQFRNRLMQPDLESWRKQYLAGKVSTRPWDAKVSRDGVFMKFEWSLEAFLYGMGLPHHYAYGEQPSHFLYVDAVLDEDDTFIDQRIGVNRDAMPLWVKLVEAYRNNLFQFNF